MSAAIAVAALVAPPSDSPEAVPAASRSHHRSASTAQTSPGRPGRGSSLALTPPRRIPNRQPALSERRPATRREAQARRTRAGSRALPSAPRRTWRARERRSTTVPRARPALAATSPAVIAWPPSSAASTAALVAPGAVRRGERVAVCAVRLAGARLSRCGRGLRRLSPLSRGGLRAGALAGRGSSASERLAKPVAPRWRAGRGAPGSVGEGGRSRVAPVGARGAALAFCTSPLLASSSVVERRRASRPWATSPAVIGSPPSSAEHAPVAPAPSGEGSALAGLAVRRAGCCASSARSRRLGLGRRSGLAGGWLARRRLAGAGRARRAPCEAGRLRRGAGRGVARSVRAGGRSRLTPRRCRGAGDRTRAPTRSAGSSDPGAQPRALSSPLGS